MNMKKYSIFALIALVASLSSCKNKVEEPDTADFNWYLLADYEANIMDLTKATADPEIVELSNEIVFVAKGTDASSYVVWTGESGHDFAMRNLPDSLIKDTVNNVSKKASGIALSSKDAMGRYYKTYNFSSISPASGFQMFGTARNYDYDLQDYSEIKSGSRKIVVVDTQTDFWAAVDANESQKAKYDLSFKFGKTYVQKESVGINGSFKYIEEDVEKGIKPGVEVTCPKGKNASNVAVLFSPNNCIPFVESGTIEYLGSQRYRWTVDLTSPQKLLLASQSSVEDGYTSYLSEEDIPSPNDKSKIIHSEWTKEYVISAKEYTE